MEKIILSNFFAHFARLLSSGKPLLDCIITSGKKSYMKNYLYFVDYLVKELKSGRGLGQALLEAGLSREYIGYINVGEWEGRLDQTMAELSKKLEIDAALEPLMELKISGSLKTGAAGKPDMNSGGESEIMAEYEDQEYKKTVKLVNGWLKKCIDVKASCLHIIPSKDGEGILKYRIGGVIHEIERISKGDFVKAAARIKFMSCLDVAEKRLPQDGRMIIKLDGEEADLRVSVVPCITGEKITIKFISKNEIILDLNEIKLDDDQLKELKKIMDRPYGLIPVTGAGGSGKTTTCYCMLHEYIKRGCSVATIEYPAEYLLDGAAQIALDPSIGLNVIAALKTAMRMDPDVIFISGPFESDNSTDPEIVNYAIKAARIGHIVILQSGYKNIYELIDSFLRIKEIDRAAMANILNGAVAQTLMRKLCGCKRKSGGKLPEFLKKYDNAESFAPAGCEKCLNSGYMGRVPVYDIFSFDRKLKEAIAAGDTDRIKKLTTGRLEKKAAELTARGITSAEEFYRISGSV